MTDEAVETAARALLAAELDAADLVMKGKPLPASLGAVARAPRPVAAAQLSAVARRAEPISTTAERYIAERTRDPNSAWRQSTADQVRSTVRLFAEHAGDPAIASVTRDVAGGFLEALGSIHRDAAVKREARGLPFPELVRRYPGPPHLSDRTLNRHAGALHGLFRWARRRGLYEGENPFADQHRPARSVGWLPFTVEELGALFAGLPPEVEPTSPVGGADDHTTRSALAWIVRVAAFSGMRLNEISELGVADVREQAGVPFFDITAAKSEAGVRRVPVHSELVRAGFMDYLGTVRRQGHEHLFPGLTPGGRDQKRGHYVSKRFTEYRRKRGVERERVSFHSFRKSFIRALEHAAVDRDRAALVIGHERGFTFRVYNPEGSTW